eukprot:721198-Hanusia_phi.AAC.2
MAARATLYVTGRLALTVLHVKTEFALAEVDDRVVELYAGEDRVGTVVALFVDGRAVRRACVSVLGVAVVTDFGCGEYAISTYSPDVLGCPSARRVRLVACSGGVAHGVVIAQGSGAVFALVLTAVAQAVADLVAIAYSRMKTTGLVAGSLHDVAQGLEGLKFRSSTGMVVRV